MKSLLVVAAMSLCLSAQAQQTYIGVGGSGSANSGGLAITGGLRGQHVGVEAVYLNEVRNAEQLVDDGAGGISHRDATVRSHGLGAAVLGFAPIGTVNRMPVELVGRAERARMRSGSADSWRTTVGAGLQISEPKGMGFRLLLDRVGDESRFSMQLLKQF